jgi:hypothetical protein
MAVTVTGFNPISKIKDGKNGLGNTAGSRSLVKITGTDLANQMDVDVYYPPGTTTKIWSGKTYLATSDRAHCDARLTHVSSDAADRGGVGGGDTGVTVTVGGSAPKGFNVLVGPPLNGSYAIKNNGTAGTSNWLAPSSATAVNLSLNSYTWVLAQFQSQQMNYYQIQCQFEGSNYYLQWANDGAGGTNVGLVGNTAAGICWALDNDQIQAFPIPSVEPTPNLPYLSGNTATGAVSMVLNLDPSGATSWTLGTYTTPPPR